MRFKTVALVSLLAFSLGACSSTGGYKQPVGGMLGAVGGGALGSQIGAGKGRLIATGAGAVLGALAGAEIGASLDRADQVHASMYNQRTHVPIMAPNYTRVPGYYQAPAYGSFDSPVAYAPVGAYGGAVPSYRMTTCAGASPAAIACEMPDGTWRTYWR